MVTWRWEVDKQSAREETAVEGRRAQVEPSFIPSHAP